MKKVVTCSQMKLLDHGTIHNMHVPSLVLMERAALATAEEIRKYLEKKNGSGNLKKERILTVCGSGNNGGDGIAIARLLHLAGIRSEIYLAGNPDKMTEETRHQWDIAMSYQVPVMNNPVWDEYTVIVDGIFGVGLSREITGNYKEIIDHKKRGLCLYPGRAYAGRTVVADIGIYDRDRDGSELASKAAWHIEKSDMKTLPVRKPWGNKGTFGKVLLVAGSKGMCGAACLSASAALHGGAGMVKIQTVEENQIPLQSLLPEAMLTSEFDEEANRKNLNWCDVLVIGPGLGASAQSRERAQWFLSRAAICGKSVVLDADGLNLLAENPKWKNYLDSHVILTPHMGEMSRLTGKSIGEIR